MRKSTAVSVALLSAAAAGTPAEIARAEQAHAVSIAPAMIERGGFGETIEKYWIPVAVVLWGGFVLASHFSGGE